MTSVETEELTAPNATNGWNIRNVNYETIHDVDEYDFQCLIKSLDVQDQNTVVDAMCGYGAVSKRISTWATENGIQISLKLMDKFPQQLDRSQDLLGTHSIERITADARDTVFPPASIDRIVFKMGIHEVPQNDQLLILQNAYQALKDNGIICIWDVLPESEPLQLLFQDIIRKKDSLAGFATMVSDRYFFRQDEIFTNLTVAGFKEIQLTKIIKYRFSSAMRLDAEFGGDVEKLNSFNEFIRSVVPNKVKELLEYEDCGDTIKMTFRKGIVKAMKIVA